MRTHRLEHHTFNCHLLHILAVFGHHQVDYTATYLKNKAEVEYSPTLKYRMGGLRYSFPCILLYSLPDDGQKLPKHVAADSPMYCVLKVVFALSVNTDVDSQTQRVDDTKICVYLAGST